MSNKKDSIILNLNNEMTERKINDNKIYKKIYHESVERTESDSISRIKIAEESAERSQKNSLLSIKISETEVKNYSEKNKLKLKIIELEDKIKKINNENTNNEIKPKNPINNKNINNEIKLIPKINNNVESIVELWNDDEYRYFKTNNWPNFEGWENYDSVNPNTPEPLINPYIFKLPISPTYSINDDIYNLIDKEFSDSTEEYFLDNYGLDAPAQFFIIGIVGRIDKTKKNKHWSDDNKPEEIVLLDPLPAACGGLEFNGEHDKTKHLTVSSCTPRWDYEYITPSGNPPTSFEVDPLSGTLYRHGYFYRYNLYEAQTKCALQMDVYGGHTGMSGNWHIHLTTIFETDYDNCVIGYALDGTPIMGLGSIVYDINGKPNGGEAISSWRLRDEDEYKVNTENGEMNIFNGEGYYHFDFIYDSNIGSNLDKFNGGYTIIDDKLTYSYFTTTDYPYWPRNIRGEVSCVMEIEN